MSLALKGHDHRIDVGGVLNDEQRAVGDEREELGVGDDFVGGRWRRRRDASRKGWRRGFRSALGK